MNTDVNHGPAKIYQFPKRAAEPTKRIEAAAIGSSWYHEEAVREAVRGYGTRDTARASAVIVPLTFPRQ
ncbi:MAG TPA: DUF2735 domain-containing protein [Afipia sp.]